MASALFKLAAGTGLGGSLARTTLSEAVSNKVSSMTQSTAHKITWETKNWPHPKAPLLHFDLAELAEKRPGFIYDTVRGLYRWWLLLCGILALNFIDSIILVATVSVYAPLSIFFAFLCCLTLLPLSFFSLHRYYVGACEKTGRNTTMGRVGLTIVASIAFIFIFLPSGNVNGIVGLAFRGQIATALAQGSAASAVGYWQAVMVIESLLWLVAVLWLAALLYAVFTGAAFSLRDLRDSDAEEGRTGLGTGASSGAAAGHAALGAGASGAAAPAPPAPTAAAASAATAAGAKASRKPAAAAGAVV